MSRIKQIPADPSDPDVPIFGARAIGEVLNLTEREAFWLLERKHIPAVKLGRKWATTRRQLRALFESGNAAA
jgi:hypothetical protein